LGGIPAMKPRSSSESAKEQINVTLFMSKRTKSSESKDSKCFPQRNYINKDLLERQYVCT
jgi:hypothetical protein